MIKYWHASACVSAHYIAGNMSWPRLAVQFSCECVLDIQQMHDHISRFYDIGYTGLYDCGTHTSCYIQTASKAVRMSPAKVLEIYAAFGASATPKTFSARHGILVAEVGSFRKRGPNKLIPRPVSNTTNNNTTNNNNTTTNNNNSVNVTTNIDKSNSTTVIHLSINAFGKEEISHIAEEQFKKLVLGSPQEVMDYMRKELPKHEYDRIVNKAWNNLQQPLFDKALAKAEQAEKPKTSTATDATQSDSEDTGSDWEEKMPPAERANMMEAMAYDSLVVNGEPIKYDGQRHSAYNKDAKAAVEAVAITKHSITNMSYWLPLEFAKLMYDCPHNNNLIHPSNAGYIKYYDGQTWIKQNACDVHMITDNWEKKVGEYFNMLEARHGTEWLESFHGWYVSEVMRMFSLTHPNFAACEKWATATLKKEALLLIDNMNARLKGVTRRTGKRVNRVLDVNDFDVRDKKVLRRTTWDELMSMSM